MCTVSPYSSGMEIRRVRHRGLLRLLEENDSRELRPDLVKRLRNILAALIAATDMTEVSGPPGWRIHQLKGTGLAHGVFQPAETGGLRSILKRTLFAASIWRIITDGQN